MLSKVWVSELISRLTYTWPCRHEACQELWFAVKAEICLLFFAQSFREELDGLIQEQMKKGGSSSNLWALRQLADFMATHGSPAALPVSPSSKGKWTLHKDGQWENSARTKPRHQHIPFSMCFLFLCWCVLYLNHFGAFSLPFSNRSRLSQSLLEAVSYRASFVIDCCIFWNLIPRRHRPISTADTPDVLQYYLRGGRRSLFNIDDQTGDLLIWL